MMEVIVAKRRRSWEWRLQDQNGKTIMSGRERTRPAARYQGYRSLFMLLAIGRRSTVVGSPAISPTPDGPNSSAGRPSFSSVRPKTGLSQ
ncbi:MAG: hypothetical protein C0480_24960 [Bradyrhizobium sp.]|nr:hypothetical protein [Bradyrhizobium sp.]